MALKDKCYLIDFQEFGDDRGKLVAIEGSKTIPFDIKRIFYIYGAESTAVRGQHANKESNFVLINISGKCKVKLFDGVEEIIMVLDKPNIGLYIPKMIWKDMYDFSEDSILLCLASKNYDENEYIKDLEKYCKIVN